MEDGLFEQFRLLIERESGIHLTDQKKALLSNRIQKRLRALRLQNEQDYFRLIETDASGEELINLIDVVSTNVTYFWREHDHYASLARILSGWNENKQRVRIWCAASSSGEEAYNLAMVAQETMNLKGLDFKILATDICTKVLQKAEAGRYEGKQLEKLPPAFKSKYFTAVQEGGAKLFEVIEPLRALVTFRKLNLAVFPYPLKGPIDVIFCRNVMIYFDLPLRAKIIAEFSRLLAPGGFLFLSHSENLLGLEHKLRTYEVAVFRKPV